MRQFLILFLAAFLVGCSQPKSHTIPSDPAKWDKDMASSIKELSPEDKRLFATYMTRAVVRAAFTKEPAVPPGTTIGDAIEAQKEFEAKEKAEEQEAAALKAKVLAERNAALAKLRDTVMLTVVEKQYLPSDVMNGRYSDRIQFVFAVKNKSSKDIAGVKGTLNFLDMFDTPIESISLSLDHPVKADSDATIDGYGKDINQFENDDQKLAVTDLSKMKVTFVPEMIVFADGTRLTAPSASDQ